MAKRPTSAELDLFANEKMESSMWESFIAFIYRQQLVSNARGMIFDRAKCPPASSHRRFFPRSSEPSRSDLPRWLRRWDKLNTNRSSRARGRFMLRPRATCFLYLSETLVRSFASAMYAYRLELIFANRCMLLTWNVKSSWNIKRRIVYIFRNANRFLQFTDVFAR